MKLALVGDLKVGDIFAVGETHTKAEVEQIIPTVVKTQTIFRLRAFDGSPYFFSNYHNETVVHTWTFEEVLAMI